MTNNNYNKNLLLVAMIVAGLSVRAQEQEYRPFEENTPQQSLQQSKPFEDFDQNSIYEQNRAERVELPKEEASTKLYTAPNENTRGGWVGGGSSNAPEDPNDVPIDGGLSLLLAAGAAYGAKRYRDGRKRAGVEEQEDSR